MLAAFFSVLFDGVAYGSLLFVISVGMSVTLGTMRIVNLAHGAFAMFGGYAAYAPIHRWGLSLFEALPVVLVGCPRIRRELPPFLGRTHPLNRRVVSGSAGGTGFDRTEGGQV